MKADRHLQVLNGFPEADKDGVVEVLPAARHHIRRQKHPHAALLFRPHHFVSRAVRVNQGDMRDRIQPLFILATEIDDPAVVGPGVGGSEFRVGDPALPGDADGGVEEGDINALTVHDPEPRDRVIAARRTAIGIGTLAWGEKGFGLFGVRAHPTQRAQRAANDVQRLVVEHEDFPAVVVMFEAYGPISILRVDILLPGIEWLQHMTVSIHNRTQTFRRHTAPPVGDVLLYCPAPQAVKKSASPTCLPISFPIT